MLYRIAIIVAGAGYVAYRFSLAWQILRAKRAGDVARVQHLRRHGFGLYRWAAAGFLVFFVVLVFIVWSNSR